MQRTERFNRADRIIKVGFWVNAALMVIKLLAGHFGRSEAVFADGVESACDFVAILFTFLALRIGRKPSDAEHPYGHGKAESLAAILVSLFILLTGGGILYQAIRDVVLHRYQVPMMLAVVAAALTIVSKEALCRYTLRAGAELGSPAVQAIATDHRKDAISSVATLIGVGGAFMGVGIMDPLAAGLTALFIFHIGYQTFIRAAHELMDGHPPGNLSAEIAALAEGVAEVLAVHEIRCRRSGQFVIVDLKLDMHPELTVKHSHAIAEEVKRLVFKRFPEVGDVMIHINPHEEAHEDLIRL